MKSVEALRKWVDGLRGIWIDPNDHSIIVTTCDDMPPSIDCVNLREHVNAILDGIEREVEELRDRDYRNGREDAEGAVEFADRLCRAAERREDVTLWGVDYTPLPVDADGEAIHVGDVMEERSGHTFEVASIMVFGGSGNQLVFSDARNFSSFREPHDLRHHHAPTVEDVLREFAAKLCIRDGFPTATEETFAEYAAKLTLRGDE